MAQIWKLETSQCILCTHLQQLILIWLSLHLINKAVMFYWKYTYSNISDGISNDQSSAYLTLASC